MDVLKEGGTWNDSTCVHNRRKTVTNTSNNLQNKGKN